MYVHVFEKGWEWSGETILCNYEMEDIKPGRKDIVDRDLRGLHSSKEDTVASSKCRRFYCRMMLCKCGLCRYAVSVRPPRSWILLKWINISPSGSQRQELKKKHYVSCGDNNAMRCLSVRPYFTFLYSVEWITDILNCFTIR